MNNSVLSLQSIGIGIFSVSKLFYIGNMNIINNIVYRKYEYIVLHWHSSTSLWTSQAGPLAGIDFMKVCKREKEV